MPPTGDATRSNLTTKTASQQRSSSLFSYAPRRRAGGQIAFPAAAHRSAAVATPWKEEADQSIDLSSLDTVSRTAAARTFPIVRAVHSRALENLSAVGACSWRNVHSRECSGRWSSAWALRTQPSYLVPGVLDPANVPALGSVTRAGSRLAGWTEHEIDKFRLRGGLCAGARNQRQRG